MSDSLRLYGLQHARLPCPSPPPRACSNSGPLNRWCHSTISSSVAPSPTFNLSQHQGLLKADDFCCPVLLHLQCPIFCEFILPWPAEYAQLLSHVWLFATPWTVANQAPLSMGFSRQEYWSGLPFPSPGDLPDPGIKPRSPALWADALLSEPPGANSQTLRH